METLNPDIVLYLALNMDVPEVLSLCETHPRFNSIICQNQQFWMNKIISDFPSLAPKIQEYGPDYRLSFQQLAYRFVQLNLVLNLVDEDNLSVEGSFDDFTIPKAIEAVSIFKLRANLSEQEVREIFYNITQDILNYLPWGYYTIQVNGEATDCNDMKNLFLDCFNDIDIDTRSVTILFDASGSGDYYRQELQGILDDSIHRGKVEFYGL